MAIGMAPWQPEMTDPLSALLAIAGKRYRVLGDRRLITKIIDK
jgi:hypothetical protein